MPAPAIRRARPLWGAFLVLLALVVSGCTGQRAPSSYNADVKEDFISGCTDQMKEDGKATSTTEDDCTCAYEAIEKDVPFSEFKQINEDQINEPSPLPASFTKAYADCFEGADIVSAPPTTEADSGKGK